MVIGFGSEARGQGAEPSSPASGDTGARPGSPVPIRALSLSSAIELLRRKNLRLVAARHEVSAARADAIAAGLISNPTLSFGAQFLTHGARTGGKEELSVMLAQSLPITGHTGLRKDAAVAAASAAEWEFAAEGWALLGELKRAYLRLKLAELRRQALGRGLADLDRVQRVLDERARAGAAPAYDRLRLEVERGGLRSRIAQADIDLVSARSALARSIGADTALFGLATTEDSSEPVMPLGNAILVQQALGRRPELRAARFRSTAATLATRAVRRRYVPEPELGVGYTRFIDVEQATGTASGGAALVSLALPLPLFDHGQGTVRSYEERSRAAQALAKDARFRIERDVTEAAEKLRASLQAYRSHEQRVGQDIERVRLIAEAAYREGKASILELLDAYSSYLRAQEQGLDLRGVALATSIELEQAIGP